MNHFGDFDKRCLLREFSHILFCEFTIVTKNFDHFFGHLVLPLGVCGKKVESPGEIVARGVKATNKKGDGLRDDFVNVVAALINQLVENRGLFVITSIPKKDIKRQVCKPSKATKSPGLDM